MDIKFSSPQISKVILGFHPPQVKIMERERERERETKLIFPYLAFHTAIFEVKRPAQIRTKQQNVADFFIF